METVRVRATLFEGHDVGANGHLEISAAGLDWKPGALWGSFGARPFSVSRDTFRSHEMVPVMGARAVSHTRLLEVRLVDGTSLRFQISKFDERAISEALAG